MVRNKKKSIYILVNVIAGSLIIVGMILCYKFKIKNLSYSNNKVTFFPLIQKKGQTFPTNQISETDYITPESPFISKQSTSNNPIANSDTPASFDLSKEIPRPPHMPEKLLLSGQSLENCSRIISPKPTSTTDVSKTGSNFKVIGLFFNKNEKSYAILKNTLTQKQIVVTEGMKTEWGNVTSVTKDGISLDADLIEFKGGN